MKLDDGEIENNRQALLKLKETEGWKLLTDKWQNLLRECARQLREKENPDRDWYAGLVTGYERILDWPDANIKLLEAEQLSREKEKVGKS